MMSEKKRTWQEKLESLVTLAKSVGTYTNTDVGTEGRTTARCALYDAYADFCEWRHEEPYVADEIQQEIEQLRALLTHTISYVNVLEWYSGDMESILARAKALGVEVKE